MNPFRSLALLIAVVVGLGCRGQETTSVPPATNRFSLQDGDRVVFLGDSITHQCLYTQYLENFFVTRFPERRIRFHNAGVAGDKASDALVRFDEDVVAYSPDYVTLLFGMNDGKYEDLNEETFAEYQRSLGKLLDRINVLGAKAIVLSPTVFDHSVVKRRKDDESWRFRGKPFSQSYNALMGIYGLWGKEEAERRGVPSVDLWGPLNELSESGRSEDPSFTLIGDAIHPQASGQVIMAAEILLQLGVQPTRVDSIVISQIGGRSDSETVDDLVLNPVTRSLSFTHKPTSLPWVIPAKHSTQSLRWQLPSDGPTGYQLVRAGSRLSTERLTVLGLPEGRYEVVIDDQVIGNWTHQELADSVELQEITETPQYQQSLRVAELNRQRNDEWVRPMRDLQSKIKGLRKRLGDDPDKLRSEIGKVRTQISALSSKADAMAVTIRDQAQPKQHRWTIRPTGTTP